jgi:hypothetical protein
MAAAEEAAAQNTKEDVRQNRVHSVEHEISLFFISLCARTIGSALISPLWYLDLHVHNQTVGL